MIRGALARGCLAGFEIGSRHFTLAPEAGGVVMGIGILAMHFIAFEGWHIAGTMASPITGGAGNTEYLLTATNRQAQQFNA